MTRAVSTALDAVVFLLLVSAAAGTLVLPSGTTAPPDASPARTVVATSTATVNYTLDVPDADRQVGRGGGPAVERHARGSLAGLLADAAMRNVTVDGRSVSHAQDGFQRGVAAVTRNATDGRTHVRAVWQPFPGSAVRGSVAAGSQPPADATVATETISLDAGITDVRRPALEAAGESGYRGVARVVARATVRLLVPPDGMRLALRGDYPVESLARTRYRRLARLLDANVSTAVVDGRVRAANDRLHEALADRFERTLRSRFDSPRAAARSISVGRVRIVVRRWTP